MCTKDRIYICMHTHSHTPIHANEAYVEQRNPQHKNNSAHSFWCVNQAHRPVNSFLLMDLFRVLTFENSYGLLYGQQMYTIFVTTKTKLTGKDTHC